LWVPETDTALSAEIVRRLADPTHAAITPHAAGRAAGLVCIADGLQDNPDNTTTFFRVQHGPHPVAPQEGDLTLALLRSEQPGVYYEACERLAAVGRGLMTLHNSDIAMPSLLVEIAPGANDHQVPSVQDILRDVCDVTVLGGYAPSAVPIYANA
jgi:prephenate dehydratase